MFEYHHALTTSSILNLKKCIGQELNNIEGFPLWKHPIEQSWSIWNIARVHFEDFALDIKNIKEVIVLNEDDDKDEVVVMGVEKAPQNRLTVGEGQEETTTIHIGKKIKEVAILNNKGGVVYNGIEDWIREYTSAIIFHLDDDSYMTIDVETSYSEMMDIKFGSDYKTLVTDHSCEYDFSDSEWDDIPQEGRFNSEIIYL